ncbi:hypothetical protein FQN53_003464 [Emmonsiellopsis sp. PD_33]|nr:hypothetical protein FQN53_003464 [Emmonsiellopsis sp. PD_33]
MAPPITLPSPHDWEHPGDDACLARQRNQIRQGLWFEALESAMPLPLARLQSTSRLLAGGFEASGEAATVRSRAPRYAKPFVFSPNMQDFGFSCFGLKIIEILIVIVSSGAVFSAAYIFDIQVSAYGGPLNGRSQRNGLAVEWLHLHGDQQQASPGQRTSSGLDLRWS